MLKLTLMQDVVSVDCGADDSDWLHEYMKLSVPNSFFARKYNPHWDGKENFFNLRTRTFSIGFWPQIKRVLKLERKTYQVRTVRHPLERIDEIKLNTESLYGDQIVALNSWLEWGGRGIIWCAPGFGKTELAMGAIKILLDRKLISSALFVCNGLDAVVQTQERINKQLGKHEGIKVTNIQALARLLTKHDPQTIEFLQHLDFLIIDECHHGRAAEFKKLVNLYRGKYRLGISASPFHDYKKNDLHSMSSTDATVLKLLGPVVSRYSASSLIEKDRLAKPIIFLYPLPDNSDNLPEYPTWPTTKRVMLTDNEAMHKVIAKFVQTAAKAEEQSLVVAGGIKKLAFNVWRALDNRNVNVKFLHGGVDKQYRNWTRKKLIKGEIDAICATTIYDEAVDLPNLRLLALAYGGLSDIKLEQRIGRDLRRKQGDNVAVILDFICTTNKHLKKHSYARLKHYLAERAFEFKVVGNHSPYVKRLFKDRAEFITELPGVEFFRELKNGNRDNGRPQDVAK